MNERTFLINGTAYTFREETRNGVPVIAYYYLHNGEGFGEWSAEPTILPETGEDAAEYLAHFHWEINSYTDKP